MDRGNPRMRNALTNSEERTRSIVVLKDDRSSASKKLNRFGFVKKIFNWRKLLLFLLKLMLKIVMLILILRVFRWGRRRWCRRVHGDVCMCVIDRGEKLKVVLEINKTKEKKKDNPILLLC